MSYFLHYLSRFLDWYFYLYLSKIELMLWYFYLSRIFSYSFHLCTEVTNELSACPVTVKETVCEPSDCLVTAKEAICELSVCPVTVNDAAEAVVNFSVLFVPVPPDLPRWFPAPSAPRKWSLASSAQP